MNLGNIQQRLQKAQESPPKAIHRFQDEIPKLLERYAIKPPQTFRILALAKKNAGYIETVVKGLEDGLKPITYAGKEALKKRYECETIHP